MASSGRAITADKAELEEIKSLIQRSGLPARITNMQAATDDPRLQLVERIASSEPFQKSSRLPPLIRYLAEHSVQHDKAGLTEQAIGRAVFDKPKDFNPAEDSSVRVYMRQLRLRLHEYYQSHGREESIVVEVPKGGYALVFHSAESISLAEAEAPAIPGITASTSTKNNSRELRVPFTRMALLPWLLFGVALLAAIAGWYRFLKTGDPQLPPWPLNAVVHADRQTTVVLADASYSMRMLWKGDFTLDDYIHRERLHEMVAQRADSNDAPLLRYLESSQLTSMADAHAVGVLVGLSGRLWENLNFQSAKDLTSSMLSKDDLIFIGSKTSNPWLELYEGRLAFPFQRLPNGDRYVQNRSPLPGEQSVYAVTGATGSSGEDYATISLLPNTGAQGSVLLIQGIRLEGTEAAIRFLANADRRAEIGQRLQKANGGKLPRYFEVLLHAHSVAGSAVSIDCIAVRPVSG